jgi:exopolysaccharide production protein ExoQ
VAASERTWRWASVVSAVTLGVVGTLFPAWTWGGIAALVVLAALRRLDAWQVGVLLLALALVSASSSIEVLRSIPAITRFAVLAVLVAWLLVARRRRRMTPPLRRIPEVRSITTGGAAFLIIAGASALWTSDAANALSQSLILALTILFVTLTATRRWGSQSLVVRDLHVILGALVTLSALSLAGAASGASFAYGYQGAYRGIFHSATSTGMMAALAMPLAWGLKSTSRRRWPYWACIGVGGATLVVSQSRGAILALVGAVAWLVVRGGAGRVAHALAASLVVVVLAFFAAPTFGLRNPLTGVVERFVPDQDEDYSSTRITAWERSVELWITKPVLGHGFRSTEALFEQERVEGFEFGAETTHNGFLQVLLELGVVGVIVLGATLFRLVRFVRRCRTDLSSGLLATLTVGLLLQFTESPMFGTGSIFPLIFWLVAAAGVVVESHCRTEGIMRISTRAKRAPHECSPHRQRRLLA